MQNQSAAVAVRRRPGRPREFEIEAALDGAVLVFRERGYHAASLAELAGAMRLATGSIYKAFRDKRALLLAALDRYVAGRAAILQPLLQAETTGRDKLRAMLACYAGAATGAEGRRGCLLVAVAAELCTLEPDIADRFADALLRVETQLRELILLGRADGSIPPHVDAEPAARTLLCVVQGLRVVGKVGCGQAETLAVVDQAMRLIG